MTVLRYVVLGIAAAAVLGALALQMMLRWYRSRTGFGGDRRSGARIVGSDTGVAAPVLLRDPRLGLRGRPDYLLALEIQGRPALVPLELKPGRRSRRIYESDALQVAAYLVALRATAPDAAAPFGYLRYATGTYRVTLTAALAERVAAIVGAIRAGREASEVHRSHAIRGRCTACAVRPHCDEALG